MANSSEDSLHAPKPNHNENPTSEVGSVLNTTMQEYATLVSEIVQLLVQKSSAEPINLALPRFNPDIAGADPAAWCTTVNLMMKKNPLRGIKLLSALCLALEGSAAHWLTQVLVNENITWPMVKELFTARFGGKETAASALTKIARERPLKGETLGAFGMRLHFLLSAKWQNLTIIEIVIAIILYILSSRDRRFKQLALTSDIKTKEEFVSAMRAFSYTEKRPTPSSDNPSAGPKAKRHRPSDSRNKCLYCGIFGHKITECRKRIKSEKQKNIRNPEGNRPAALSKVSCFKCHEEGHVAPNCPLLRERNYNSNNERQVDSSVVEAPTGRLSHLVRNNSLIDPNVTVRSSPYRLNEEERGTKAKVVRFNFDDFVLRKTEERNQTKLDPKYKGPFVIAEILEADRYILKILDGKRSYKYSHDRLRKMPDSCVPAELDVCSDDNASDNDDMSTPIPEDY
ncbi:uncharacterized protein LOC143303030 [Bombus vancouverensis nearcticus]|uniref:uncharacterized protein LOC143303030 n=1 Tax=Bombus vancouverensis nearcticus TaxID=2705178 RepID=UPI00402B25BC